MSRSITAEGINCPTCNYETRVIDTRGSSRKGAVRRRRECLNANCRMRSTTYEVSEEMWKDLVLVDRVREQVSKIAELTEKK